VILNAVGALALLMLFARQAITRTAFKG
jgi:hypothetical protein